MSPNPSLFQILNSSSAVKAILGSSPLRVFPYGEAKQNTAKPYAVYTVYNGTPENYLTNAPDIDNHGTQIDIFAETGAVCEQAFRAIRDAVEPYAHMTNFSAPQRDFDTQLVTCRLEFDFWEQRS